MRSEPVPQPQRPGHGGTDPGPRNLARDRQNPDLLVPPSTDHGTLPNLRFSFSDSHVRQESGGWTRQITVRELGISKGIAGVPRASLVVIAATLSYFHLPEAGLLLILAVDHVLDMGRSATNVLGNSVASAVVAKWEGQIEAPEAALA